MTDCFGVSGLIFSLVCIVVVIGGRASTGSFGEGVIWGGCDVVAVVGVGEGWGVAICQCWFGRWHGDCLLHVLYGYL